MIRYDLLCKSLTMSGLQRWTAISYDVSPPPNALNALELALHFNRKRANLRVDLR